MNLCVFKRKCSESRELCKTTIVNYHIFLQISLRWSETKSLKTLIIDNFFFLPLDGDETLHIYRTWKYIAKTEVEMFLTVIVSMVTV